MVALSAAALSRQARLTESGVAAAPLLDPPGAIWPVAPVIQVRPDDEIIAQGAAADHCYQVLTGCVRTVLLLDDGRRQVGQFMLPGDLIGWEASGAHCFGAEAVTPATLRRLRRFALEEHAAAEPIFADGLRLYIAAQMRAARAHLVLLGRKTAGERVASFLLEMHARLQRTACAHDDLFAIDLPMGRGDVADYLGLTVETVCRGLTELRRQGIICVARNRISIRDDRALRRHAGVADRADRLH